MTTLIPAPPLVRFGRELGPVWTVVRDGTPIGEILLLGHDHGNGAYSGWHQWRAWGMPHFAPTQGSTRAEAIQLVEWAADRASGYQRPLRVPDKLVIAALRREQANGN